MLEFFFFESLFPESFHILVVHLEELIEGSGSDVSAAIESGRLERGGCSQTHRHRGLFVGEGHAIGNSPIAANSKGNAIT